MQRILFIAPAADLFKVALRVRRKFFPQVMVRQGLIGEGVRLALRGSRLGYSIFVSRGRTASAIQAAAIPDSIVVETPITPYDYMRAFMQAATHGRTPAAVVFQEMAGPFALVSEFMRRQARLFIPTSVDEVKAKIQEALAAGADVIVGGEITCRTAQELGAPCVRISTGEEAVIQALREACRIQEARTLEATKTGFLQSAIDHNADGMFITDAALRVTMFSPPAAWGETARPAAIIGRTLHEVWPEFDMRKISGEARKLRGELSTFNGREVRCALDRIQADGKEAGLVLSFREAKSAMPDNAASGRTALRTFDSVIGASASIRRTVRTAKDYALTEAPLLITGEPGSGKTLFAECIHSYSRRASGPFVTVPCALVTPQLLEPYFSESGAPGPDQPGVFETARGGTLFFDEIADLDANAQSLLLDMLRGKILRRRVSGTAVPLDVRIMACTTRDLIQRIRGGQFRADLYYAVNVLHLHIPALHERPEDISSLAQQQLLNIAPPSRGKIRLGDDALLLLRRRPWEGNVRELYNMVERAAATSHTEIIEKKHLQYVMRQNEPVPSLTRELLRNDAIDAIRKALLENGGRYQKAAEKLGIDRSTLWRRMKKLGLR